MAVGPGTRLGVYEVIAQIGEGGMGQVYRATDTKLKRQVAIKVLPPSVAADHDRLARFQREAEVLASLNHPNIAAVYGLEDGAGVRALVMELVEGEDLSQRIARGAIPLDDALLIATQIAAALEAAHEQGIVHRDLKPANIKVRADGTVKVLDFGLAKATEGSASGRAPGALSHSPTMTSPAMTRAGLILGTVAYMSPEQARGQPVDKRTDVWAFGCVVFEMLTGQALFARATASDALVAILDHEPAWTVLPATVPAGVRRLLTRCLVKDPRQRLRDVGDARLEISELLATPVATSPAEPLQEKRRAPASMSWMVWTTLLGMTVATAFLGWSLSRRSSVPSPYGTITRLVISPPPGDHVPVDGGALALAANGRRLAYVAGRGSRQQIFVREFDQFESTVVPGTEGGYNPFLSPDGQWLGFFADGKLKKVIPGAGEPVTISDAAIIGSGTPTWEADDTILFTPVLASGIMRVPAAGGKATPVTTLAAGERAHQWPQILPGGKTLLFSAVGTGGPTVYVQSLDTGQRRPLVQGLAARYLSSGHLVFTQAATIMAVRFDPVRLETTGTPVAVMSGVLQASGIRNSFTSDRMPQISLASVGAIAFVPSNSGRRQHALVWVDGSGVERPTGASGGDYSQPRLSPDGRRIAVTVRGDQDDVWLFELSRQTWSRFTTEGNSSFPVWARNGRRLTYVSDRAGVENMYARSLDGTTDQRLLVSDRGTYPLSLSKDGTLAFVSVSPGRAQDIWTIHPDRNEPPQPWLETTFSEGAPAFSPDGQSLAYVSNESGRNEIYIQPYPGPGQKVTISSSGGNEPVWSESGELFYRSGDGVFAVGTSAQGQADGRPRLVFEKDYERSASLWPNFDVSPDGLRILMVKSIDQGAAPAQINMILNWVEELERLVPTK